MLSFYDYSKKTHRLLEINKSYVVEYNGNIVIMQYLGDNKATFYYGGILERKVSLITKKQRQVKKDDVVKRGLIDVVEDVKVINYEDIEELKSKDYIEDKYEIRTRITRDNEEKTYRKFVGESFDYEKLQEDLKSSFSKIDGKTNLSKVFDFTSEDEYYLFKILSEDELGYEVGVRKFEIELDYYSAYSVLSKEYEKFVSIWKKRIEQFKKQK